ncbi:fungal specific transcription factor domain-containing protein [Colletotrichum karsti]|uniref:Fungal specific transcription factor domain-containing protein n=1 Tax=Colletotrichum karsti TaxID=1095194 RepID=A0A9P6I1Q2_9PEZI|nr:fungal specific transcription factor domain-containing protein [Colletotrichum karsti]KAF9872421.1 fungal specific transcription factor domain-containing protein [Colletotrichum karsti]
MENVDRSLREVSQAVQKLLQINEKSPAPSSRDSPSSYISTNPSNIAVMSEGYRGDSSFNAHVHKVTDALRDAASNLELTMGDPTFTTTTRMIEQTADSEEGSTPSDGSSPSTFKVQYPELEGRSLPPIEKVLKLLRLAQVEKQRFFVDCSVVDEQEFTDFCQKVYFAVNDYSILSWVIVNTGLFYLFLNLKEHYHAQIGVTYADILAYSQLLKENIEAAMQSLRLCNDPCMEACQAFSLLYTYCNRSGRSPLAWQMISAASRMCIDLGWHRLPKDGPKVCKERQVFWHIYIHDKGMAFTLGRTPSIHPYDVSTPRPTVPDDYVSGVPIHLYVGYVEYAIIVGDMHIQLFSAVALQESQQNRIETAKSFASKILQANRDIKQSLRDDPPTSDIYLAPIMLFDVIMFSLVTIAYRIVPCEEPNQSPLKCNIACIDAARKALNTMVQHYDDWGSGDQTSWTMLLNIMFSMLPFAAFVVLAGNTIATSSSGDLALMASTVTALEPMASSSPSGRKLYDVCKTFHQLASFAIARQTVLAGTPPEAPVIPASVYDQHAGGEFPLPLGDLDAAAYDHIMAPQDWDTVMNEFELGTGAGAMASFVEPYMPFGGRL